MKYPITLDALEVLDVIDRKGSVPPNSLAKRELQQL